MDLALLFFMFILGLFFGSFFNVVADRIVNGESILFGRSHCEFCRKNLKVKDLVPLLSYIRTGGKCSYCKTKLSWTYPLSELLTGVTFAGLAYFSRITLDFHSSMLGLIYLLIVFSFYIILFLTDLKYKLIPDKIVVPAIIFVLLFTLGFALYGLVSQYQGMQGDPFGRYLIETGFFKNQVVYALKNYGINLVSALLIGLGFVSLVLITKGRGMGGGDIRLGVLVGLFNGFPSNIVGIFLGFLIGALYSILLIVLRKSTLKDTIPFGPFLIMGSVISFFWGDLILNWYFNGF